MKELLKLIIKKQICNRLALFKLSLVFKHT